MAGSDKKQTKAGIQQTIRRWEQYGERGQTDIECGLCQGRECDGACTVIFNDHMADFSIGLGVAMDDQGFPTVSRNTIRGVGVSLDMQRLYAAAKIYNLSQYL